VSRIATTRVLPRADADAFLKPRAGIVEEVATGDGRFGAGAGPVSSYERRVSLEDAGQDRVRVTETIEYRLAIPFFGWLFGIPIRRALARGDSGTPWWAPPDRVDARGSTVLGTLAVASMVGGYVGGLLSHTIAFAGREFDAGASAQGAAGIAARFGGVIALLLAARAADRLGRRRVILWTAAAGCLVTALGAAAPSLPWHAAAQALSRPLGLALLVCIGIAAAEEMPRGSRAYAVSVLGMSAAAGSGIGIVALPLADLAPWGWRLLHVLPLVALPFLVRVARYLPETLRFERPHVEARMSGHLARFWLLAASAVLANLFFAPASFFLNKFLVDERGFSATAVAVFTVATATPGVIGVLIGGRLADTRGRRPVGAVALVVATLATTLAFHAAGSPLWLWTLMASVVGSAAVPALGVYGPELFPTSLRGRVGGLLAITSLVGSAVGLIVGGAVADSPGGLAQVLVPLSLGPLAVAALVLLAYPETARRELEELNPEDRTSTPDPSKFSP
jgi:MFS family permease